MNHILSQCVKTFPKLGDNKIVCWDESNSGVYENELVGFLAEKKEWAFVSDYLRLKALYEQGGIYLDTDILVENPLIVSLLRGATSILAITLTRHRSSATVATASIMVWGVGIRRRAH